VLVTCLLPESESKTIDESVAQEWVNSLQVLQIVAPAVHPDLHPQVSSVFAFRTAVLKLWFADHWLPSGTQAKATFYLLRIHTHKQTNFGNFPWHNFQWWFTTKRKICKWSSSLKRLRTAALEGHEPSV